jgi:transposase-like protein
MGLTDIEIGQVICSTNPIESLNARYRRARNECGSRRTRACSPT